MSVCSLNRKFCAFILIELLGFLFDGARYVDAKLYFWLHLLHFALQKQHFLTGPGTCQPRHLNVSKFLKLLVWTILCPKKQIVCFHISGNIGFSFESITDGCPAVLLFQNFKYIYYNVVLILCHFVQQKPNFVLSY